MPDGLLGGGIAATPAEGPETMVQLVAAIGRNGALPPNVTTRADIPLAGSALTTLSLDIRRDIVRRADEMIGFIGSTLEWPLAGRFIIVLESDHKYLNSRYGTCVLTSPEWWTAGARDTAIFSFIACAWWGVGCRIDGPAFAYACMGIGSALALCWLEERGDHAKAASIRANYRAIVSRVKGTADELKNAGLELALALVDDFTQRGPVFRHVVQFTRAYWGREVSTIRLLQELSAAGAIVPPVLLRSASAVEKPAR